jgi:hypothetical protein
MVFVVPKLFADLMSVVCRLEPVVTLWQPSSVRLISSMMPCRREPTADFIYTTETKWGLGLIELDSMPDENVLNFGKVTQLLPLCLFSHRLHRLIRSVGF